MKRPWLAPLVPLYAAGIALRDLRLRRGWEPVRVPWFPVISVGNLSTGGAGKTPFTVALAHLLQARGYRVNVLSRGYGRDSSQPMRVDPAGSAQRFGDEPLLIARSEIPVYVAAQRYDAAILAERDFIASGGTLSDERVPLVHLLDDGFQHRQLHRDIDILLLNREDWQDSLLPAGNLREPLRAAARAHVIAIPTEDPGLEAELRARGLTCPIWRIRRRMEVPVVTGPVAAFCGIARPAQFFAGLEAQGLRLVLRRAFPDHHRYTSADLNRLATEAFTAGATALVTTEKDAVRIGTLPHPLPHDMPLLTATLTVQLEDEPAPIDWLERRLAESHLAQANRRATDRHASHDPSNIRL
ncbi:MAG: tetraacyldisaccharide 4'-kinase [Acidobacteriota bacterium]|nr:tetraacyldisaccharide 4'-kinase [Acidobacteriota bacterium]